MIPIAIPSASAADEGWGQQGHFALGPSVRGPPNSAGLVQIRSGSSVTLRGPILCICSAPLPRFALATSSPIGHANLVFALVRSLHGSSA